MTFLLLVRLTDCPALMHHSCNFSRFPVLEFLWLPGNRLTGTLSSQICSVRGNADGAIQELVVNPNNQFAGCCCDVCNSVEECDDLGLDLVIE